MTAERLSIDRLRALLSDKNKPRLRSHPNDDEHRLQVACVRWFRYRYPHISQRLFAVPNGGRRDAATGARLKAEGVLAGVADIILLVPRKNFGALLIEMKTTKGRQSEAQRAWQTDLCKADEYKYIVCRTFSEFQSAVQEYLQEP